MNCHNNRWVVGLGELLWDVYPDSRKLGGAPANFAFHVAQFGIKSMVISAIGNDDLGRETASVLTHMGLTNSLAIVPHPTGTVQVELDSQGIPTYNICQNVAWDNIPFSPQLADIAANCRAVCFGSLAQRSMTTRKAIQLFLNSTPNDCLKIFDINLRQNFYSLQIIENSLRNCNILKINDEELLTVTNLLTCTSQETSPLDICKQIASTFNIDTVILTCGINGSHIVTASGQVSSLPTPCVDVVDTVGAGDAFTAAFCAAILSGKTITQAHHTAVDVSAYVCTQPGAMPAHPQQNHI